MVVAWRRTLSQSPDTAPRKQTGKRQTVRVLFTNMFWSGDMNAFVSGQCVMSWCRLQWRENGWMWARAGEGVRQRKCVEQRQPSFSFSFRVAPTEWQSRSQLGLPTSISYMQRHTHSAYSSTQTCNSRDSIDLTHSNRITFGIWLAPCTVVDAISLHRWCEESKSEIMHKSQRKKLRHFLPLNKAVDVMMLSQTDSAILHFCCAYTVKVYYDVFMVQSLSQNEIPDNASMKSVRRSIPSIDFPFDQNINQWPKLEQFFSRFAAEVDKILVIHLASCSPMTCHFMAKTGVMRIISWKWHYEAALHKHRVHSTPYGVRRAVLTSFVEVQFTSHCWKWI